MKSQGWWTALLVLGFAAPAYAQAGSDPWATYLDYAYVYSSADPQALQTRLGQYGREAGLSLEDYLRRHAAMARQNGEADELAIRREAIAYLLFYLSSNDPESLEKSVDAVQKLEGALSRHENRYWYHYVLAHRALERGRPFDFVAEMLDLWLYAIVPLETPYETLRTLALSESPNTGFVAALPYLYENVTRLILLRSPQMGVNSDLDPLGGIALLLHDGRVGAHPDVIPLAASSKDYLDRIVARLAGPESDGGSLTFTLALFEASKYHDQARGLLASEGLSANTVKALRVTGGAYQTALNRANTDQGQAAVYTRVLRLLGEVYAARQRLGGDPDFETSFSIEGAIKTYGTLYKLGQRKDGFVELGYGSNGREAFVDAMHGLWEEIQEATLNASDFYLSRAVEQPHLAAEYSRNAARLYARYLQFFDQFTRGSSIEFVPDSAYFAAYESARGYGDAFLVYAPGNPKRAEMEMATRRYVTALNLFPFDWQLWPALTRALERQGRSSDYQGLVRPIAESVTHSRHVNGWTDKRESGSAHIAAIRRALSDDAVVYYLGFAEASSVQELDASIQELRQRRRETKARLAELTERRRALDPALGSGGGNAPAAPDPGAAPAGVDPIELADLARQMNETSALLARLDKQIEAGSRAIPLYKAALKTEGFTEDLRTQRDHPVHTLLRRMYHEKRS